MADEDLDVSVRPHLFLAWALLALAVALALPAAAPGNPGVAGAMHVGLVGATLLAQGLAFWYFPSFTKRAITLPALVRATPHAAGLAIILLLAGAHLPSRPWDLALRGASALFGLVLLAQVVALAHALARGPSWRGGTPFWKKEGEHQPGDRAAALTLLLSLAWLAVAGLDALLRDGFVTMRALPPWLVAQSLFVLGALAHLLPRTRGAPYLAPLFLGGVFALNLGGVALLLSRTLAALPLGLALAGATLAAVGLAATHGGRPKPAGPRLRDTRPFLVAAWLILLPATLLALAAFARPLLLLATLAALAALVCGLAAVSLLALPVLMNQRPAKRWIPASAALAPAGVALLAAGLRWPPLAALGALALAASVAFWLATLYPLRRPRRDCAP